MSEAAAPASIAATRLWCCVCREPRPFRNKPMPDAARQRRPGWHGEHLVCGGCGTTLATCYVDEKAADA